jgi:hypothetical protein
VLACIIGALRPCTAPMISPESIPSTQGRRRGSSHPVVVFGAERGLDEIGQAPDRLAIAFRAYGLGG